MARRTRIVYSGSTLTGIIYPVALCMIITLINEKIRNSNKYDKPKRPEVTAGFIFRVVGLYHSYDYDRAAYVAVIAFLALIFATTLTFLSYLFKLYAIMRGYVKVNMVVVLLCFSWIHFRSLCYALNIPVSVITATFLTINFGCLTIISIHKTPSHYFRQFCLIAMSALTALLIMACIPDWTVWAYLFAMSLWDIFAVLSPIGPLRLLLKTARDRDEDLPAVTYNALSYRTGSQPSSERSVLYELEVDQPFSSTPPVEENDTEDASIVLGLGDFIFYSIMISNVAETSSVETTVACFIANLAGVTVTLPIVYLSKTAMPALPLPIFIVSIFYFSSFVAMTPFVRQFNLNYYII